MAKEEALSLHRRYSDASQRELDRHGDGGALVSADLTVDDADVELLECEVRAESGLLAWFGRTPELLRHGSLKHLGRSRMCTLCRRDGFKGKKLFHAEDFYCTRTIHILLR